MSDRPKPEADTHSGLDPVRQATARRFAHKSRALHLADWLVRTATLAGLALSGLGSYLRDAIPFARPLSGVLFLLIIVLAYTVLSLPVSYYRNFVMPRQLKLGTQSARSWLSATAKHGLLVVVLLSTISALAYWAMDAFPAAWWWITGLFVVLFAVALNWLAPVAILPLFFRLTPIDNTELGGRLLNLARRAGAAVIGVYTGGQSGRRGMANAVLIGMGRNRRIVLSGGVTHVYTPEEIEAMMAHEMGHAFHRDIPRLIAAQLLVGLAGFLVGYLILLLSAGSLGLNGVSDTAGLPLIILGITIFSQLSGPLVSAYMRKLEHGADTYALQLTGNADAFISLMTKLADQNLNEANPSRLAELIFYRHPSYQSRVERAIKFREQSLCGALQCSG